MPHARAEGDLAELVRCTKTLPGSSRRGAKERTIEALRAALEKAGVEFIAENGARWCAAQKDRKERRELSQEIDTLEDKISSMPAPTKPTQKRE